MTASSYDAAMVYLAVGSNIEPERNLPLAIERLVTELELCAISRAWETLPVGTVGPCFLNAAVALRTHLTAEELRWRVLRPLETSLGRNRTLDRYAPRPIDLDIIMYNGLVLEPQLWCHAYLAVPLAELVPDFTNHNTGMRLGEVAARLSKNTLLRLREDVLPGSLRLWL